MSLHLTRYTIDHHIQLIIYSSIKNMMKKVKQLFKHLKSLILDTLKQPLATNPKFYTYIYSQSKPEVSISFLSSVWDFLNNLGSNSKFYSNRTKQVVRVHL